MFVFVLAASA